MFLLFFIHTLRSRPHAADAIQKLLKPREVFLSRIPNALFRDEIETRFFPATPTFTLRLFSACLSDANSIREFRPTPRVTTRVSFVLSLLSECDASLTAKKSSRDKFFLCFSASKHRRFAELLGRDRTRERKRDADVQGHGQPDADDTLEKGRQPENNHQ